jgi:hypothetical protein
LCLSCNVEKSKRTKISLKKAETSIPIIFKRVLFSVLFTFLTVFSTWIGYKKTLIRIKNVDIKFNLHSVFWNNIHQVCSNRKIVIRNN